MELTDLLLQIRVDLQRDLELESKIRCLTDYMNRLPIMEHYLKTKKRVDW